MKKGAKFNEDRTHRFVLWRIWDKKLPMIMFVGVNPSKANENEDDPTIRRVVGFAKSWGYGGVYMVNVFCQIATKQKDLLVYRTRFNILQKYANKSKTIVFAWGKNKFANKYLDTLLNLFPEATCLAKNLDGSPKHPLYIASDTRLTPYKVK